MSRFYPESSLALNEELYNLSILPNSFQTQIKMTLSTNFFHTNHLPSTVTYLKTDLPRILKSKCFNEENLPFHKEVLNTEIGHLFEHILLEYLCSAKISSGAKKAVFRGLTSWNWKKDTKGTFYITVYIEPDDVKFFNKALRKSILLFNRILTDKTIN